MYPKISKKNLTLFIPFFFFLPRRVTGQKTISTMNGPILYSLFVNSVKRQSISHP